MEGLAVRSFLSGALDLLTLVEQDSNVERVVDQDVVDRRLQRAEALSEAIPFDAAAARAYGRVYAQVASLGSKAGGKRALDLLIAATALAAQRPLHTRNPSEFDSLEDVIDIVAVSATNPGN